MIQYPMQGYIINTSKVKDEDLLVTVLNPKRVKTLYRFYGARHSQIQLGYKIDYEAHPTNKENLFQLRNVTHLTYKWILQRDRFYIWQQFLKLLYRHLRDINEVDSFYFELLEEMNQRIEKEDPKRSAVLSYVKLLKHEGRIHNDFTCFICGKKIEDRLNLQRAYLPACSDCIKKKGFLKSKIIYLFDKNSTLLLDNEEIDELYSTLLEGF